VVSGTDLTLVTPGAPAAPVPALSRSTSTEDAAAGPGPPSVTANAHRPSGAATTPNGLPPVVTVTAPTPCSGDPVAVALEQPGEASPRSDREGGAAPAADTGPPPAVEGGGVPAADAGPPLVVGCSAGDAGGVLPDVHPAPAPTVTAVSTAAVSRPRAAKPRPMRCRVATGRLIGRELRAFRRDVNAVVHAVVNVVVRGAGCRPEISGQFGHYLER
jgi:hypothetical protein